MLTDVIWLTTPNWIIVDIHQDVVLIWADIFHCVASDANISLFLKKLNEVFDA